jgi:hypothetical protein
MSIQKADSAELIEFANRWAKLGQNIQDQVTALLDDPSYDANPNAIIRAMDEIGDYNEEISLILGEWLMDQGLL